MTLRVTSMPGDPTFGTIWQQQCKHRRNIIVQASCSALHCACSIGLETAVAEQWIAINSRIQWSVRGVKKRFPCLRKYSTTACNGGVFSFLLSFIAWKNTSVGARGGWRHTNVMFNANYDVSGLATSPHQPSSDWISAREDAFCAR